jgi:hypothetical protein
MQHVEIPRFFFGLNFGHSTVVSLTCLIGELGSSFISKADPKAARLSGRPMRRWDDKLQELLAVQWNVGSRKLEHIGR